jgi:hypothetical protein
MAHSWSATTTISRPWTRSSHSSPDGTSDTKFSSRVQEINKTTDGPPGVGTVYSSAVKDAGLKSSREYKLTEFEQPKKIAGQSFRRMRSPSPTAATTSRPPAMGRRA